VFQNIGIYVLSLKRSLTSSQDIDSTAPAGKKRKLAGNNHTGSGQAWANRTARAAYAMPDVVFVTPVRKKMRLEWVPGGLRAMNSEGEVDFGVAWADIGQ